MARSAVLAGRTAADTVSVAFQTVLMLIVAYAVGYRLHEGGIEALPIAAFSMMRAMSTRNDDPEGASRPFDKDRDGFVFGEAGALMVIETEEHAKARGAQPLARPRRLLFADQAADLVERRLGEALLL